jgi:hypothetical protein
MRYIVTQPFNDLGTFRCPGDFVDADDARAAKLRAMGLIGGAYVEHAIPQAPIEAATTKKANRKPLQKKVMRDADIRQ